jgi:hypothetical protein
MLITQADVRRFWKYVEQPDGLQGCWIWTGGVDNSRILPTGRFWIDRCKRRITAHRFSWALAHRRHKMENIQLRHLCGTPLCVNPRHFMPRILKTGIVSGERHGRYTQPSKTARGDRHGKAKLDSNQVRALRHLAKIYTYEEVALRFGISKAQVEVIVDRKQWKDEE